MKIPYNHEGFGIIMDATNKFLAANCAPIHDEVYLYRGLQFALVQLIVNDGDDAKPMPAWELRKRRMEGQHMHAQWLRSQIVKLDTLYQARIGVKLPPLVLNF